MSNYINNTWQQGQGDEFTSTDAINHGIVWQGNAASKSQVTEAITAAHDAFPKWSRTPLADRIAYLEKFATQLEKQKEDFALTISEDTGKPLWETTTEVGAMLGKISTSIKAYHDRTGSHTDSTNHLQVTLQHRPHGVLVVIGPFNFPGHLPNGHIVPALLAGNTIVLKPSTHTPKVAEKLIQIWEQMDLPPGVLNMVHGGAEVGQTLIADPRIAGVLFTGSFAVGSSIHKRFAGQTEKIVALEMGGNNPLIIADVNDVEAAAYHTIQSAFITAGQRCTCARRLILQKNNNNDEFITALKNMIGKITAGHFSQQTQPFMGPVISVHAAQQILQSQDELKKQGGGLIIPMKSLKENTALLSPGLMDSTNIKDRKDNEIFGPFLQILRVENFDAAMQEANNTAYGLSAGLLSDNKTLMDEFSLAIRAGVVNVNKPTTGASGALPFGGIGHSGNHRPSAYYAADYCAYPLALQTSEQLSMPEQMPPGINT